MALKKTIVKPNGIALEYHRIVMVKIDVNQQVTVLLHSYVNEEGRNYEKAYAAGELEEPTFPYVADEYISFDYDETMSVKNAYEWLKQQPEYLGAIDV